VSVRRARSGGRRVGKSNRKTEAAVQLAPYVHSKMPALVVQLDAASEQYVIRVPNALPDEQAWSHAVSDVKAFNVRGGS
jgi:hypothetical protein